MGKPDIGQETAKENTILSLSQSIMGILESFQAGLDILFSRQIQPGVEESKDTKLYHNVLDEIIENLEEDKRWLNRIVSFVATDVLPKIS